MMRLSVIAFHSTHSRFTISLNRRIMSLGDLMSLGKRIRAKRQALGLSQQALAQQLNVSNKTVSKWENDTHVPDLEMLTKLANCFGCSLDELIEGKMPLTQLETILSFKDFIYVITVKIKKVNLLFSILIMVYLSFYLLGYTLDNCEIRYQVKTMSIGFLVLIGLIGFFYNKRHWVTIKRYRLLRLIQSYDDHPILSLPLDTRWVSFQTNNFTLKSFGLTVRYDQVLFDKIDVTDHWYGYRLYGYLKVSSKLYVIPLDQKSYPLFKYKKIESEGIQKNG